ncbi:MAG: hypothetical protein OEW90_20555 [Betaproteobacteria bacterium]|nr:hypothetical protein [Betaproteobacteria bacterium]
MKTYQIELQRFKGIGHDSGMLEARVDVQVLPVAGRGDDAAPASCLRMTEANARVLLALLKGQLAELDKRKARSQRYRESPAR